MNVPTLVVATIVILIVALILRKLISDKKNHRSSCGGACKSCPNSSFCHPNKDKK